MTRRSPLLLPLLAVLAGCGGAPHQAVQRSAQTLPSSPDAQACLAGLGRKDAGFTPLPDQYYGNHCSALNTVKLVSLKADGERLAVTNLGPVTCTMADAFAAWARFGVDRAARQIIGQPLSRIETMGSYSCRNVAGTARLSAHATASAIDVGAFVFADGKRISITRDWNSPDDQTRAFLRTVRDSACKRFGTVLDPSYNAAHHDHLHLELKGTGADGSKPFCR